MNITHYTVETEKVTGTKRFAVVADLHNGDFDPVLPLLTETDAVLVVGDLVNRHNGGYDRAVSFLKTVPECVPVYYSIGNHERKHPARAVYWPQALASKAIILDNAYVKLGDVVLGGLSSAPKGRENNAFLREMEQESGFRLLMCHHPEYFTPFVKPYRIDLTLAGHAHGGQIQLFGQGLYAPGQGVFPKLTHGFYEEGRLLVSRGMTNSAAAPRLWNPCELIILTIQEKKAYAGKTL